MALFDPIERELLKQSLRHFIVVMAVFFFAALLDASVGLGICRQLLSARLIDGMHDTAWQIFQIHRCLLYYVLVNAGARFMFQFTIDLWRRR